MVLKFVIIVGDLIANPYKKIQLHHIKTSKISVPPFRYFLGNL